ncbi:hypothetical protein EHW99_3234 [Erwinia amylovora]|uniref:Uncharacterized protein n=3 Tax=Erwinia amylovora TaxID=552 RepID=A0A831ES41_ERWAM|nr:hypothetical protein EaACW_0348 [Erwinia amylovora ACW56400]QJQ55933.1 hypothetical protein EHX00_3234 [Erwinia amylovora]CBA19284.1 hypothetical protein predicted by Glimmer/Critica [Erwinia amylovora CFBP1430]CBX79157.1 hypothetical protein predicted by Glimmer/Critica [Erwinia amylovora ATCC BAA-2158]CCO77193.1 hypothetical protein BN432_0358 [Erwinia amylovora Ea356]CCO80976.1 hypothetical protein BN433_0367 [Erwinia amylovora Ea266]CCO84780.1 hypothetical protein BN434_0355 [Erwinia a
MGMREIEHGISGEQLHNKSSPYMGYKKTPDMAGVDYDNRLPREQLLVA